MPGEDYIALLHYREGKSHNRDTELFRKLTRLQQKISQYPFSSFARGLNLSRVIASLSQQGCGERGRGEGR